MTTKRSFGLDTTSISTESPILDAGYYAGEIANATVENKDHESFFKVQEEKKWNKGTKQMEKTGAYEVSGLFMYSVLLTSKAAIKSLQRDEPRIFGGMLFLKFDKETHQMKDNPALGQLLKVFDLQDTSFDEMVDFEMDESIAVPTELQDVPDIIMMLNSVLYHQSLFTLIAQAINNLPCMAKVVKRPQRDNKAQQENSLDMGTGNNPFCGVLPYEDGKENDLEEE